MNSRIIHLIIAAPVTITLFLSVLFSLFPAMPIWAGVCYVAVMLVAAERVAYIYEHFKGQKS